MEYSDIEPIVEKISLFGGIEKAVIKKIFNHCEQVEKETGDLLFHENDPATEIFIIIKGKIKLIHDIDETPYELIELLPGASLGETSVIGIQPHGSSAVVTESTSLLVLSRQLLNNLHEQEPEIFTLLILNIARELARRLHKNRRILQQIKQFSPF